MNAKQVKGGQVAAWLLARAKKLDTLKISDNGTNHAYQLGVLEATFTSLLNNPHSRKELMAEIKAMRPCPCCGNKGRIQTLDGGSKWQDCEHCNGNGYLE